MKRHVGLRRSPWPVTDEQVQRWRTTQDESRKRYAAKTKRQRDTGPTRKTRDLIREGRARLRCEVSGVWLGRDEGHTHHRRPRRAGGDKRPDTNQPQNLLLVHPDVHQWIEDNRAEAHERGLLLHDKQDPLTTPVQLRHGRVLLDASGGWRLDNTTNHPTGEAAA